jgi:hypothetical protein
MSRTWITASVALTTVIFLTHGGVVAQRGQAAPMFDGFAVEIVRKEGPGSQFRVLDAPDGGFIETSPDQWLPDWKQPEGVLPLTRLRLRALMEDGGVRIKVFAVFDDSYPVDSPGPKYGAREQPVANYLVREGETILVRELTDFGVEPLNLRVVRATPQTVERPLAVPGEAVSKLDAVSVVAFGIDTSEPTMYRLSLRNLTQKNITALQIYQVDKAGRRVGHYMEMWAGPTRPVIMAGGMYETHVDGDSGSGRMTPQGFMPDPPQPLTVVIGTVVFDDGTYEGEAEVAARMEARQIGRRIQFKREVSLLDGMLNAPEQDVQVAVEKLKSQVSTLRIDVDVSIVNKLLARYPSLSSEDQKKDLTAQVMDGLRAGREELLYAIKEFSGTGGRNSRSSDFRAWLSKTREKYDAITLNH